MGDCEEKTIKIENNLYCVAVNSLTGAIYGIFDKTSGIDLLNEQRLADNFRLLLPLPNLEANYIIGKEQRLSSLEQTENGAILHWNGPLANPQGKFDLDVDMRIEFAGQTIEFRIFVNNRTQYKLAEVWYPMLGGFTDIEGQKDADLMLPSGGGAWIVRIFENFPESMHVGGGVPGVPPFPEFITSYPTNMPMSWVDLYSTKLGRGVYFACHDITPRYKSLRLEMQPATANQRTTEIGRELKN